MKHFRLEFLCFLILVFSCSEKPESNVQSNEWELVIEDSIQVDYLADIREGTFNDGIGVIKDLMSTTLVKFDTTGKILTQKEFPKEGPGSITFLSTIHFHEGKYFGLSSFSGIFQFDSNLELLEKIELPFLGESRGGAYNKKDIQVWKDNLIFWYPGRNGISPYMDFFYRDHPLLEILDLETKDSKSIVRIPPTSKFSKDEHFGRPEINFTIQHDSLYLSLSNEPLIHVYSLSDTIFWVKSLDFKPTDFIQIPGQKEPVTYSQQILLNEARIQGIYSDSSHLIVNYTGGIPSEIFVQNELKERKNFYRYPEFRNTYLKIHQKGSGWSNEIVLPKKIKFILNIESVDKPFYALRNDEFIGEEQEYLTFYKLKLVRK
jgi:hypothetical protein